MRISHLIFQHFLHMEFLKRIIIFVIPPTSSSCGGRSKLTNHAGRKLPPSPPLLPSPGLPARPPGGYSLPANCQPYKTDPAKQQRFEAFVADGDRAALSAAEGAGLGLDGFLEWLVDVVDDEPHVDARHALRAPALRAHERDGDVAERFEAHDRGRRQRAPSQPPTTTAALLPTS